MKCDAKKNNRKYSFSERNNLTPSFKKTRVYIETKYELHRDVTAQQGTGCICYVFYLCLIQ